MEMVERSGFVHKDVHLRALSEETMGLGPIKQALSICVSKKTLPEIVCYWLADLPEDVELTYAAGQDEKSVAVAHHRCGSGDNGVPASEPGTPVVAFVRLSVSVVWRHLEIGQLSGTLWLVHLYACAPRLPVVRVSSPHLAPAVGTLAACDRCLDRSLLGDI